MKALRFLGRCGSFVVAAPFMALLILGCCAEEAGKHLRRRCVRVLEWLR